MIASDAIQLTQGYLNLGTSTVNIVNVRNTDHEITVTGGVVSDKMEKITDHIFCAGIIEDQVAPVGQRSLTNDGVVALVGNSQLGDLGSDEVHSDGVIGVEPDVLGGQQWVIVREGNADANVVGAVAQAFRVDDQYPCLLYTSDAADD